MSYAKEKHNAVNTSRKRIGFSRKDDRKSGGQGRTCSQRRNSSQCCTSGAEDSLATIGKKDRDSWESDHAIEAGEQGSRKQVSICEKENPSKEIQLGRAWRAAGNGTAIRSVKPIAEIFAIPVRRSAWPIIRSGRLR